MVVDGLRMRVFSRISNSLPLLIVFIDILLYTAQNMIDAGTYTVRQYVTQ